MSQRKGGPWWAARRFRAWAFRKVVLVVQYSYHGLPIDAYATPAGTFPRGATWLDVEREVQLMIQRQANRKVAGVTEGEVVPCALALQLPTLFDYLTQRRYADGSARQTSSVLIFEEGGILKGMLRDRDLGLCCWVAGNSLEGLFAALEAALGDPEHEWRVDRQAAGQKATRVKK